ncbi:hypothetical protein BH23PSE2_BH23PSE2_05790 [soil metagenome]
MNTQGIPGAAHSPDRSRDAGERSDTSQASLQARFRNCFRDASYYSTGRDWDDYAPAYRYGEAAFKRCRGKRFEDVEPELEQAWADVKSPSRLLWAEARGAVLDAWSASEDDLGVHRSSGTRC